MTTPPTGSGSSTERPRSRRAGRGHVLLIVAVAGVLWTGPRPAAALDLFTLWRQPIVPLDLTAGSWADYRRVTQAGGRWDEDLVRIACLGSEPVQGETCWVLEILPLDVAADAFRPRAGEGLRLLVSASLQERQGRLIDLVRRVEQWRDGDVRVIPAAEWRDDPLIASSFDSEFTPDHIDGEPATVRVVGGRELPCDQFLLTAADSQVVDLPAGRMVQVTRREISVAVHAAIPFLGIAFVAERMRAESRLDPPSDRFDPPPPVARVESMELLAFGGDAEPHLKK